MNAEAPKLPSADVIRSRRPNAIVVNSNQRGNPVLKYILNVPWEHGETLCDYELGRTSCALFLSLRYHKLHPNYIYERFQKLGKNYNLRILLVLVDVKDHGKSLRELMRVSVSLDFTLILSWSSEEAGRYLETFKAYEHKSVDLIAEKTGNTPFEIFQNAITDIKSVNKTDSLSLAKNFKTFREIATLTPDDLSLCPGFGDQKIVYYSECISSPVNWIVSFRSMNHLLSVRTPFSPIVIDYAKFLAQSGKANDAKSYGPIVARLGFQSETFLTEMRQFYTSASNPISTSSSKQKQVQVPPPSFLMTQINEEAILALSVVLESIDNNSQLENSIQLYLIGILSVFPQWKVHCRFKQNVFIEIITSRLFQCLNSDTEGPFFNCLKKFVDLSLNESSEDLEYYGNVSSFIFKGILNNPKCILISALTKLFGESIRILESSLYDIRTFLPEAPIGAPLNEILRKYFILPASALASSFHSLRVLKNSETISMNGINFDKIILLLLSYSTAISSFLSNCEGYEAELSGLLKLILKMLKIIVPIYPVAVDGSFAAVQLCIQSSNTFKNISNYREILSDSCQLLLECAKIKSEFVFTAMTCFRDAVIALDFFNSAALSQNNADDYTSSNFYETASSIGPYIGALFRMHLDQFHDRTACDSILNSLLSSIPEEPLSEFSTNHYLSDSNRLTLSCPHAIATLGHIAGVSGDEQIALSCLANLTAQFNKGNYDESSRIFFTQFNLIAVTGSGSLLANILDIYTNIITEANLELLSIAMDELGKSLVPLCRTEIVKLEVLLFTLMRSFIDKGVNLIKKKSKGSNIVGTLRPVLFAIWTILEFAVVDDFINKAASVDLFQEFWFVLLFHGYQAQLKWDPLWLEFIPRISEKSPLLIKEKDRIQTSTTFSITMLTQLTNSALKSHLIALMPNCAALARNISLAQCLWLLAFYQSEMNKLELGKMITLMAYLKSDVVYYLDLYSFIEDLSLTMIKDWLTKNMIIRHPETTSLALLVLSGCGNIQKRIHKSCLKYLKLILSRERGLEGCKAIWIGLLDKLELLYKTCRAEMGIKPDAELLKIESNFIKDPEYAKEAFEDILKFSREVFQTASYLYPHEYFKFVMNYFQSSEGSVDGLISDVSYRNVALLELLKSCHPETVNYFQLPLEMHRNSESHFQWHLFLSKLNSESVNQQIDESLLRIDTLWSMRDALKSSDIKNLMSFINQKYLLTSSVNSEYLEIFKCLIHLPFISAEHEHMNFACKLWSLLMDKFPKKCSKSNFLISELFIAFNNHFKYNLGIFDDSKCENILKDPFKTKMTSTPSAPGKLELGVTISTFYLYLIDFLRERFLIDSRDQPNSLYLYSNLIQLILDSTLKFKHHGWSRAARFRILLFSYEILSFLRNFCFDRFGPEIYRLKAGIYRSFVDFFERPKAWSIQTRDLFDYEVRTNSALVDYLDRDSTVPVRLAESNLLQSSIQSLTRSVSAEDCREGYRSKEELTVPSSPIQKSASTPSTGIVSLRQLIKYFLIHENESIQVWIGTFKPYKMTLPPRAFWREYAAFARDHSPQLALRFCQMVKLEPEHGLIIPPGPSNKTAFWKYLGSIEVLEYFFASRLEIPNFDCFLFADPVSPPLALAIFRSDPYKKWPKYLNFAMRSLESYPPDLLFFYIPQIVQNLRHDENGYTETTIMHIVSVSSLFAHQVIWNMKANMYIDDAGTIPDPMKPILETIIGKIVANLHGNDRLFYEREFSFFEKVTGISGLLKPFIKKEKWEKKKKIDEELKKIEVDPGVYLPSNPESCVIDIDYSSGRPLQSFAKAPFMATFKVMPTNQSLGHESNELNSDSCTVATWQSCIFKVGDDCRQDVMTLQLISAIKTIFESSHLHLYLFPYRVVATAPGCGVIEVIPNSISRDMLGREKINSLYEYFWFKYGNPNGIAFQTAREEFIKSMAAYSVITYLVAIRDRHNGNIMIDDQGHIIHIDFGFVLDIAPGGITFEKSPFKLTSEMIQVMGGKEDSSPYFLKFQTYCVEAFLVLRPYSEQLIQLVDGVKESGLPCFKSGDTTIRNLRQRFRLDLDEAEARAFFANLVSQSCENVRTDVYDWYQSYRNGIPY